MTHTRTSVAKQLLPLEMSYIVSSCFAYGNQFGMSVAPIDSPKVHEVPVFILGHWKLSTFEHIFEVKAARFLAVFAKIVVKAYMPALNVPYFLNFPYENCRIGRVA
jgi:hypothetical protein